MQLLDGRLLKLPMQLAVSYSGVSGPFAEKASTVCSLPTVFAFAGLRF
jgi:hypothetical protein